MGTGREGWDRGIQGTFLSNFARAQYDNQDGKLERQVRKMRKYIAGYRLYTYSLYVLSLKLWHNQAKYRPNRTQKTTQGLGKSGGRGGKCPSHAPCITAIGCMFHNVEIVAKSAKRQFSFFCGKIVLTD